jgi:uncharacterized LabA/DUF88 family protein
MKVSIFIDGKNFYKGWRANAGRVRLDHIEMSQWLLRQVKGTVLTACHYYTGVEVDTAAKTQGQQGLARYLDMLEMLPGYFVHRFTRRERSHKCTACGEETRYSEEKEVDTTIVADILRLAAVGAFDTMVLVSGDTDHLPAIRGVRTLGKMAYVSSWAGSGMSTQLRRNAFDHIDLMTGLQVFSSPDPVSLAEAHSALSATPNNQSAEEAQPDFQHLDDSVLKHVRIAMEFFSNRPDGFLGTRHFVNAWKNPGLAATPPERQRAIDRLINGGYLETYEVGSASALKLTSDGFKRLEAGPDSTPA